jgi:hypothetical protein
MLDINASEDMVLKRTGLTCQLWHAVAEFFVPILLKVFPSVKSSLTRLSLVLSSNLPPCLQALGEQPLDNVDDDVVFVVGDAPSTSDTTFLGLAISVHDLNMRSFVIIQSSPTGLTQQRNS